MKRRSFLHTMAGTGALWQAAAAKAQQSGAKTRLYRLDYYHYKQGDQGTRLNQFFTAITPLMAKHSRAVGVFTANMAPRAQTMLVLSGFSSSEEMTSARSSVESSAEYRKAFEDLERGAEPPYDSGESMLLAATDFSPEIVPLAEKPKTQRYFELRVYHSPTQRQLKFLHERFAGAEIKIFHRSGVHPIFYANTVIGPDLPNLVYMMPFATLADREKAWDAFAADPEWVKARAESVARGGQIVSTQNISLWRANPYSPIQ